MPEPVPLPEWLSGPVEAVLADLQRPTPIELRFGFVDEGDGSGQLWMQVEDDPGGANFPVSRDDRRSWLLVVVADCLQDQVFPESRGAWGEARPECPGHAHPAQADEHAGEAWWTCPADGRRVARIGGGLPTSTSPPSAPSPRPSTAAP